MRAWFASTFEAPTEAQIGAWEAIATGGHVLLSAPTGNGKTLAAMLAAVDRLVTEPEPEAPTTRVLYISPLRALAVDIDRNLRGPLAGIALAAERLGETIREPRLAIRTGDTPARDRQRLVRYPPDLLITTPESLYLMLTSRAAATLAGVRTVIIDEIHALAPTKRGAHLALSLERLEELLPTPPQRIGLSATQRPLTETARFLGGFDDSGAARPVQVVDAGSGTRLEVEVVVPVEDMSRIGEVTTELRSGPATAALTERRTSIWPSVLPEILTRVMQHRSTIIFCNARRAAERLAAQLNELAEQQGIGVDPETGLLREEIFRAHHGSLARAQRTLIEDQLKRGELRAIVATSSLELGIDMGAVELVIHVESPGAVSRGLQRFGRAGHQVGVASRGSVFPKHRSDLVETAVVVHGMLHGQIEPLRHLRSPLDVLAQQIVAAVSVADELAVASVRSLVRRSAPFAELSDDLLHAVLDLLAGRYPSDEFSELRPRLVWDRTTDLLRARQGSQRLAVTSGGTIPDRGLFGVFLPDGTRVGELDEEMVYESRPGEVFVLGASTWRIEQITFERVLVTPAPGEPGKMPYWHGDRPGRPAELGRAIGAFQRAVRAHDSPEEWLRTEYGLDHLAAVNLMRYLDDQAAATGAIPDDRTIVVERFRDEIGDWRVCILTPFGTPVHAPWAMAIEHRLSERFDMRIEIMWSDDGIVLRLPEAADEIDDELLLIDPDEIEDLVVAALPRTAMFSARFRECAARALLLPRRRPDRRTPLWQQRQRAADLLTVAARHPTFPILLETSRECLHDVFDLTALRSLLADLANRRVRTVHVDTPSASPMASSLLFSWIAAYMYEGDTPLAERRAAALALDRNLLHDLLGAEELRELIDPLALQAVEDRLQGREHPARSADELHDLLVRVGDLTRAEVAERSAAEGPETADDWLAELLAARRIIEVVVADSPRFIASEDASRYRDALGCMLPGGLPAVFTEPVPRPLEQLVGRYARTHGPFRDEEVAQRLGVGEERIAGVLGALHAEQRLLHGEFTPGGVGREWCDPDVLRRIRRASLARLRDEVEPVEPATLARFAPEWHQIPATRGGYEALIEAIGMLAGCSIVASTLERDVLPLRVARYRPAMLDELLTSGEVVWVGDGSIGARDGRIRLLFADGESAGAVAARAPDIDGVHDHLGAMIRERLAGQGASFLTALREPGITDEELVRALWSMVWAGEVTNDSLAPLRAVLGGAVAGGGAPRRRGLPRRTGPPAGAGRWSLVTGERGPGAALTTAMQLVERHGVLTREAVAAEGVPGGFAEVYRVLRVLEERGRVRRGYFVAGLGAAQFALPGAVDRLRALRSAREGQPEPVVLAATDPAQLHGTVLPWPETAGRPVRSAPAVVVLHDGEPSVWFDRRSHHLVVFGAARTRPDWPEALIGLVAAGRARSVEVRRIDGEPVGARLDDSRYEMVMERLRAAGFTDGYRGLVAPRPRTQP